MRHHFKIKHNSLIIHILKSKAMKKVVYLLGIMLLMAGVAKAQDAKPQNGPEIEFEKTVHDYGDVPYQSRVPHPSLQSLCFQTIS